MGRAMLQHFSQAGLAQAARPIPAQTGIGLRFPHHDIVLDTRPDTAWFEVHPENYLGPGVAGEILTAIRERYPVSLHATGLSLGSADGIDPAHLAAIVGLSNRIEPGLISDHLSWSSADGLFLPDLLPLPYTSEALAIFARNIDRVQSALKRPILIENPSVYLAFARCEMSEGEFLRELVQRTGCGLLLDINNVAVTAGNLGESPQARLKSFLDAAPHPAIGEIHLAGHAVRDLPGGGQVRIDDHGSPVSAAVWSLYEATIAATGPRPTLIEWDTDIPAFAVLAGEAATAQNILDHARLAGERADALG
jgi:uncharacterized protein (UPF0276 family)